MIILIKSMTAGIQTATVLDNYRDPASRGRGTLNRNAMDYEL